jgi:hypothetical protein
MYHPLGLCLFEILYSLQLVSNEVDDKFCQPSGSTVAGTCICGCASTSLFLQRTLDIWLEFHHHCLTTQRKYNNSYGAWAGNPPLVINAQSLTF